ncbi:excinuclease ABC subunit C [candidate division Kazan bacterium RIFCSPHIGHO2_01_FULL_44_14]|uniref:UvrABC system protein C n=1 Tax=candidate division Kazan bacterium RIFCSPLOWO2_01_FULL_45_19 TaxID=1798538 RepID=A0A1F4NPB8_UNCK3|nr:MAG: excinuclease ABC subunit C [candidate division Kazan bacterium RIFCSPLOWO2_01_FULL_45_19]OGB77546.1 MAG: excinuclease ABC subunit C [candidate division Kazan bacterium RIFCSPHIGHO2_01_FULL_44_14]
MTYKFSAKNFPDKPGVYLMYGERLPRSARNDEKGPVLYVGKAKNLKKRLSSYFQGSLSTRSARLGSNGKLVSPKTIALVERIHKIDTIAVKNELEALLLENELIKKYRPNFNVVMRDDKSYLYIRITVNEEFPRILLARKVAKDGARYFGPYASSGPVYEGLKLINRTFPVCTGVVGQKRACMNYHLKICPGVCVGRVSSKEYRKTIDQVMRFLHGNYPPVIKQLKAEMQRLSANREFERAARIRDGLKALEAINERQSVVRANLSVSEDAIGVARELNKAMVVLLQVRSGKLLNQQQYAIDTKYETELPEILAGFLRDYYSEAADLPKTILLPEMIEGNEAFERWLTNLTGKAIGLKVPAKGRQRAIVRLAQSNAQMKFNQISGRWKLEKVVATEGVKGLKKILKLKKIERIEAYDISNLQGTDSVGAMVVWEKGQLDKKQYRRFKIKTVVGPNDFASLAEVLKRRFAYLSSSVIPVSPSVIPRKAGIQIKKDNKGSPFLLRPSRLRSTSYDRPRATGGQAVPRDGKTTDGSFVVLPDVVLIDGGKGQVNTIARVLKDYKVAVIGIAKGSHSRTKARDELILWKHSSFAKASEDLRDNSPTKMLLQNIRDEVHRFAVAYHTSLRKKRTITSGLEKIAGIGAVTRKKLIKAFGSMAGVRAASAGEIAKVVGENLAKKIKDSF